jgi:threonine dehydratase
MSDHPKPTLHDVIRAREHVYRHLKRTPLHYYSSLSELIGAKVWVKLENHQPVGAFKVRGGINLAANLSGEEKKAGLFTASTGNHGQSIAFAARAFGIKATIAMPEKSNPHKVSAIRRMGAEIIFHGKDFDEARLWIEEMAEKQGGRYVGPSDELLISGVGTYALEIVEDLPEVESIIVPVGGGSGASGTCIVAKAINPEIEVIAAQSARAPAMQLSWASGKMITAEMKTFAEGVATRVPFENTQRIMRKYLDDFVLVDDDEIEAAILLMMTHTHNLTEGAGAIPLATALKYRERMAGKKVVLVLTGGNLSMEKLRHILVKRRKEVR